MTAQDLLDEFRRVLDDQARSVNGNKGDVLWTDEEVVHYINAAIDEACERSLLIEDRSTPCVTSINLAAGQAEYRLHPSVIKVERVVMGSRVLRETSTEALDDACFAWENQSGQPLYFIQTGTNTIRLVRTPRAEDVETNPTLALTVYRTQLTPFTLNNLGDELRDIKPLYQLRLMPWVYRMAYLKHDADTYDATRAQEFEALFTQSFGERPDANVQRKRRDKRPPLVKMSW